MIATSSATLAIDALVEQFAEMNRELGVRVVRVSDSGELAGVIRQVVDEAGTRSYLSSAEFAEVASDVKATLERQGITQRISTSAESALDAEIGVALARNGISETGSVLMAEATLADRAVSLLSKTCIQVVKTDTLLPRLEDAAAVLRSLAMRPNGAYATLVTGPSRTADIELSLTVGVQGPETVIVVFVDSLS